MRAGVVLLVVAGLARADVYAVVAGVEQYANPELTAVPYAAADARAVWQAFTSPGVAGLPAERCALLVSDPDPHDQDTLPTRANVLLAVKRLGLAARPEDTLVVFFAGHGIETAEGQFLLTSDSDPLLLEETGIALEALQRVLTDVRAGTVVLLVDACRNDPYAGRGAGGGELTEAMARGLRPRLAGPGREPKTVATLLACQVGERAWAQPDAGHGAFTRYLLEGLRGGAVGEDGTVGLVGLAAYVTSRTSEWSSTVGRRQSPMLDNPDQADPTLARPRPTALVEVVSEPVGCRITVDGQPRGTAPCIVELDLGLDLERQVQVVAEHDGYAASVCVAAARRAESTMLTIRLRRLPSQEPPVDRPAGPSFLGAELKDVAEATAADRRAWPWLRSLESGVLVTSVLPAGPAEGRLEPGMVVLSCDGERCATATELGALIRARRAGDAVRLLVRDSRSARPIEVILAPAPEPVRAQLE